MRLKSLRPVAGLAIFLIAFSHNLRPTESVNIMFFFGVSTYSHRIIAWPLVEALAERNHSVTFFQPDKNKSPHPNVTEVNPKIDGISDQISFLHGRLQMGYRRFLLTLTSMLPGIGLNLCDQFLQDPEILEWINRSKYDLIYIDGLFNECAYGIAYKMKAKVAIFSTSHPFGWYADALGFPSESWWVPEVHFSFDLPMKFMDRVWANLSIFYFNIIRNWSYLSDIGNLLRERLEIPDMPDIQDLMANTSLVLTNTHFSEELARSLPPNVVPVGGMNCMAKSALKKIPQEMENFIQEGGEHGFVLVSFGSGARISDAPEYLQNMFFQAFEKQKHIRFIWKWETARPKGMPSNVLTSAWIPQQELLAHPRARAFMTHGGLLSMHESICHKIPMVAFPVFAEQDFNAERLQRTGRGLRMEISTLTQEELDSAIHKILTDDSFKEKMAEVHERFLDRPQSPVETSVWWTEYILRHKDTSFMRPLAANLTWYQRRSLDVWALFVGFIIVSLAITVFLLKLICQYLWKWLIGNGSEGNQRNHKKTQ